MPNFKFGQPIHGNVFSYQTGLPYRRNVTTRNRTTASCAVPTPTSSPVGSGFSNQGRTRGGYEISRYNPAYDRLEEGSVVEDWIPRDIAGLNKMFRIIYTRDSICGPAIDIMANLPWSSFDLQGVEDRSIMRFYEDAAQIFGDRAQELPAITVEYLVLGRFCASLIYDESKGYWTDFVPHDSDFLTITPIPVRNFDPKIDMVLSPGIRQFVNSTDYRDVAAITHLPERLINAMRTGGAIPLDPLNTVYVRRKSSPYDFVGTSALCVTGDTLISTARGLRRIDNLYDGDICPAGDERLEIEHVETVATIGDGPAKTSHWVYSGVHPTITMRSRYGYTITGTHKHPVLTLNPATLDTEWVRLDKIAPGSLVAVDVSSQVWPVEPRVIDDVIARMRSVRSDAKRYNLPMVMTVPLARLLGYLVSEGYIGRWVYLGSMDKDVADDFADTFLQVFPDAELKRATGKDGYHRVTCYSSHIRSFLRAILDDHTTTDTKQIPQVILESTREHAAAFLASLYEGDGSAAEDAVVYYSKSRVLLNQVQMLLLKFGILAQQTTGDRSSSYGDCSLLSTQGVFRDQFVDVIGFRTARKNRFNHHRHVKCGLLEPDTTDYVEGVLLRHRKDKHGRYETEDGRVVQSDIWSVNRFYRRVVSRNADDMTKLADISPTAAAKIREVEALGYFWDTVESLMDGGRQPVYDLCVPDTHAFIGNGLVLHNTRIIPWWAVEKALMNAMVTAARRRAGNILHITAGLDDRWEPTPDEMDDIANLFIQAEEDPVGAVVATRTGVSASEVRQGGEIWKWTDEWQVFSEAKMRGLGISEGLLSGDATYNNAEQARSVFTEQILTLRQYLTQQLYYRRFKTLARAHGFRKRKQAELDHRVRLHDDKTGLKLDGDELSLKNLSQREAFDIPEEDLIVPTIQWHKSLLPEGDREYLDLLSTLKEQGIPIPLKVWAARGGYDLEEALEMLDEDVKLRDKIKDWQKKTSGGGEDEMTGESLDRTGSSSPFWDAGKRFMQLRKSEAARCLQRLVDTVHQPGKHEALADTRFVTRTCHEILGTDRKTELMGYLLMRLGIVQNLPVSPAVAHDIAEYIRTKPGLSERRRVQELQHVDRILSGNVEENSVTASLANRDGDLRVLLDRAKTPVLALDSPNLYSGAA